MSANNALKLAIMAGVRARVERENATNADDPIVSIASLAYWDGIYNMAASFIAAIDEKRELDVLMDDIVRYASDVIQALSEKDEEDDG